MIADMKNENTNSLTVLTEEERKFVVTNNLEVRPSQYFTGRKNQLKKLSKIIEKKRNAVLVCGMGGIGKTHFCKKLFCEYYAKHAKYENGPFKHIGYIEYDGSMDSSLQNCLLYKKQEEPEADRKAAWLELEDLMLDGKTLIIIDNVNKSMEEDTGLKRLNNIPGVIVITSRESSFSNSFELFRLDFLEWEQCRKLYDKILYKNGMSKVKPEEIEDLKHIIVDLAACHTLTIEMLAHLVKVKHWHVHKLRSELEKRGFQLEYRDAKGKIVNLQSSYEVLYDLSGLTAAEQNVLEAFSVFPYIPLKDEICSQWMISDAGVREEDDIFYGLYQKGWLQFDMGQEGYMLHPVFAAFIHEKCKPRSADHCGLLKACQCSLKIPDGGSVLECAKYIPFAENVIEKLEMEEGTDLCSFLSTFAELLKNAAVFKKAEQLYHRILVINKNIFGVDTPETADSYDDLAEVFSKQGKYKKAEELYRNSLQIREKLSDKKNELDIAKSYNNLARMYSKREDYKKAEELYQKCLEIRERCLEADNLDKARTYNNLAYVYARLGENEKAEELYKKCLQVREKKLGKEDLNTVRSYNNLARTYTRKGEYENAEKLYKVCIKIREEKLGKEHPDTARVYFNLAELYFKQKKETEAEDLLKKSLDIRESALGEIHPDTADSYQALAEIYEAQHSWDMSLEYYFKAYRGRLVRLGQDHSKTCDAYERMSDVYTRVNSGCELSQWIAEHMSETDSDGGRMMKKKHTDEMKGYTSKADTDIAEKKGNKTVFLSYTGSDEKIADRIDKYLSGNSGITVKRDKRDIQAWKSIREFMKSIRKQDYAVLIVSEAYLKSKNCMFEAVEVMKEQEYTDRIFPVVVDSSIYEVHMRANYIKYWEEEYEKLEKVLEELDSADTVELAEEARQYKSIASSVSEFLSKISDNKNPEVEDIELQIEKIIMGRN